MAELPEQAHEVLDMLDSLFQSPRPETLGDVLVTRSLDDVQNWLHTDEQPGEGEESWLDLRERMSGKILGKATRDGLHSESRAMDDELNDRIERHLRKSLPEALADFENDITADLVYAVLGRLYASHTEEGRFFERLLKAYEAGVLPCGWEGDYPEGRLAVYVPGATSPT